MLVMHQAARAAVPRLAEHEQQRPGPIVQAQATYQRPILSEGPALPSKRDKWDTLGEYHVRVGEVKGNGVDVHYGCAGAMAPDPPSQGQRNPYVHSAVRVRVPNRGG